MSTNRRSFLKWSAAASAVGLGAFPKLTFAEFVASRPRREEVERARESLSILVIGGTGFTGPEQVEHALARGHRVTVINRNKTRPDFFKGKTQVEQLVGDLSGDMSALKGRSFDAVLDIPTTYPYWVRNVAQYLKGKVKHYTFISTQSVYANDDKPGADESDTLATLPEGFDPYTLDPAARGRQYGPLKAFSEKLVQETYPNSLIIRPGLIVGPLDPSDRFTYWPVRIDKGGEVIAPGNSSDPVQFIDSRDLAEWTIRMIEAKETGIFNASGPAKHLGVGEMLYGIKAITTADAQFVWIPADFLQAQGLRGWKHMPVWINPLNPKTAGFSDKSVAKAVAKGLTFRPLAVTAKDILDWHKTRPAADQQALADGKLAGTPAAKEVEVIAAWRAKQKAGAP